MSSALDELRGLGKRLTALGLRDVEELAALNERQLLALPGIGPGAVARIGSFLAARDRKLAVDPYAAYECARHSDTARDAELRSYFLCDACRNAYSSDAFSGLAPEWVSGERIDGYCGNCNELLVVRLSQWFACGTCDRVMRSIGRSISSARFVEASWARSVKHTTEYRLVETDPVALRPRGKRSDPERKPTVDFEVHTPDGQVILGLELKSGRSALPRDGVGTPMSQFQLDTTDCDDITTAANTIAAPVLLVHAQVIGRAEAPTERYVGVGLWFARPWEMLDSLEAVRQRPRETRDAAYFKTKMFRPFSEIPAYLETELEQDRRRMTDEGFPPLYQR
ncbi:helix-hairpin-helix domain-containing protein [Isoptericola sp. NPDC057653]|uniref:helix-hairpin-helix domain-containing protein n=1 Tax=Isoptericola sp. NPDC057653 TaxID=3346195 RepID=UPI00369B2B4E